jgi:hypothetical protein
MFKELILAPDTSWTLLRRRTFTSLEHKPFLSVIRITNNNSNSGVRGSVVGWDSMLQAGRSLVRIPMRSLDFSIYLILPAAIWPWGRLSLWEKWVPVIFLGVEGGRRGKTDNLTAIFESIVWKLWEPRRLTTLWAPGPVTGIALPCLPVKILI